MEEVAIIGVVFLTLGFIVFGNLWRQERSNSKYWYNEYQEVQKDLYGHLSNRHKMFTDRLNHLKSDLAQEKNKKMDKQNNTERIKELEIKIKEIEYLRGKL